MSNPPSSMQQMQTLLKRLEAATKRLEDVASTTGLPKDVPSPGQPSLIAHTASESPLSESKRLGEPVLDLLEEYDDFLKATVDPYVSLSKEIGGLVAKQAVEVLKGFQEQRMFLVIATKAAKPDDSGSGLAVLKDLLKPTNEAIMATTDLKEANRSDMLYNHLASVADGVMMLVWVTLDHHPYSYVEDALGSAQFFGNRVLKEYREKDQKHVEWIQAFYQIFRHLAAYVKRHHPNGIAWNPKGEPAGEVAKFIYSSASQQGAPEVAPSALSGAPPPPPPPPPGPPPVLEIKAERATTSNASSHGGLQAVFSEINQGESVTKGLRKVDKSEMTHKNPSLRATSAVSDDLSRKGTGPPGKKPKPESMRLKKSGRKGLEGRKWTVENYEKEPEPVEIEAALSHSVLISRCNNTTVIIRGKATQITIENSTRLSLVVGSLVSTVDVVKANSFALQVLGIVPTVMLDQIDGAQIYFSKESSGTKIYTSKCSGVNLNFISGPEDDYKEVPIPSQICSYYDAEKDDLVNEIVALAG